MGRKNLILFGIIAIILLLNLVFSLELNINSPEANQVYSKKQINLDISTDAVSTLYIKDNLLTNSKYKLISKNILTYNKKYNFNEGTNDWTFKVVDSDSNFKEINKKFLIDTKKPKILKTLVDNKGKFLVEFNEDYPVILKIIFGNQANGFTEIPYELSQCQKNKGKYKCEIQLTFEQYFDIIEQYSNQEITYWFNLTDVAEQSTETKKVEFFVDITPPNISELDYVIKDKKVTFQLTVDEILIDKAFYYDKTESNPQWKLLCSSLKNNQCKKMVIFSKGNHKVDIKVYDKAGLSDTKQVEFNI